MRLNNLGSVGTGTTLSVLLLALAASAAVVACGPSDATEKPAGGGDGGSSSGAGGGGDPGSGGNSDPGAGGSDPNAGGSSSGGTDPGAGGTDPGAGGSASGGAGPLPPFDAGTDPARNRAAAGAAVCDRLATIQCAGEQHCCQNPGRTFDQCKATQLAGCMDQAFLDDITLDTKTGYDINAAEAAFNEFENKSRACDPGVGLWGTTVAGLRGIVRGTRTFGTDCTVPVSIPPPPIAVSAGYLASCSPPETVACLPALGAWQCVDRAQVGGDCFTDVNCVDGLYCPNPDLDIGGASCTARKADGQGCTLGNECTSFTCYRSTCVPATSQTAYCLAPP